MNFGWAYDGVNTSFDPIYIFSRNTGKECHEYLSVQRKWIESIIVPILCVLSIKWAAKRLAPINNEFPQEKYYVCKNILLLAMTFTFGLEMGLKFASRTVIYVLNPCHITTIIQIYILAAKPSKHITWLFRIQMNYLNGPVLAMIFPETDSRILPVEIASYWIQHGIMFIIPMYLLWIGGPYNMEENILDFTWTVISFAILMLYHFVLLVGFSNPTKVNLNHMLCPALSDPFAGPNYRVWAIIHETILCGLLSKIFYLLFVRNKNKKISASAQQNSVNEILFKQNCNSNDLLLGNKTQLENKKNESDDGEIILKKLD